MIQLTSTPAFAPRENEMSRKRKQRLARTVGVLAVGMIGLGVPSFVHNYETQAKAENLIRNPASIPDDDADIVTARTGDTADSLARELSGPANWGNLSEELRNQTEQDGLLLAGHKYRVEKELVKVANDQVKAAEQDTPGLVIRQ